MAPKGLEIRDATAKDIRQLVEINNAYLNAESERGFLISPVAPQEFENLLLETPNAIQVAVAGEEVAGFVETINDVEDAVIQALQWRDAGFKKTFLEQPGVYIRKVAVKRQWLRQHVGQRLYEDVFARHPGFFVYSFVVIKPTCNVASLRFHQHMGFTKAAIFQAGEFHGLRNYESLMMARLAPADH